MQQLTLAQANQMIASALARSQEAGHRPMGVVDEDEAICIHGVQAAGLVAG
jgi:hypothetical protein